MDRAERIAYWTVTVAVFALLVSALALADRGIAGKWLFVLAGQAAGGWIACHVLAALFRRW